MSNQDFSKNFHSKLSSEFKKIDEFQAEFQHEFIRQLNLLINVQFTNITLTEKLEEHLLLYAKEIFSCAGSVPDKDRNYNEWRLKEEFDSITFALEKTGYLESLSEFAQQTHKKAKEIMVSYFPGLVNLSANGFRLLEKYCLLYNREFVISAMEWIETETD